MKDDVDAMSPMLVGTLSALRRWIASTQTSRRDVSWLERASRAALMVPVFSLLVLILRIRATLWGRPLVRGTTPDGDTFECRPPDLIQLYIWIFGIWEPDLTDFIGTSLREGDTFIDVGANIGVFSMLASRCVGAAGSVVAVEASPRVYQNLLTTFRLNGDPKNVRPVNVAAASSPGEIAIFSGPSENTGLTTTVESRGFQREGAVRALPLDDILSDEETRGARLLKIDVEGGEPGVLAGITRFLERCRPDAEVLIELSPHWWEKGTPGPSDVLRPLLRAGFNPYEIDNNYWPWRYLWPKRVTRPRRLRRQLDELTGRVDLIMSRINAEYL